MTTWLVRLRRWFILLERRYQDRPVHGVFFAGRFLVTVILEFYKDHCFLMASGLTFTALLSLVPVTTVVFSVYSKFPAFQRQQADIKRFLFEYLVAEEGVRKTVTENLYKFTEAAGNVTLISLIALFITAISLFLTIEYAMNVIWAVRRSRPLTDNLIRFTAALVWAPLLLAMSTYLSSFFFAEARIQALFRYKIVVWGFTVSVSWLMFFLLYWIIPYTRVRIRPALAGGFVAANLWELAKLGFAFYVGNTKFYTSVYGNLSTIPVFLLWVYVTFIITLLGAEISYCLQSRSFLALSDQFPESSSLRSQIAIMLMVDIGRHFYLGKRGATFEDLADRYRISPDMIRAVLQSLEEGGFLLLAEGGSEACFYVPARSLERITLEQIQGHAAPAGAFKALAEDGPSLQYVTDLFEDVQRAQGAILAPVTLEEVVRRQIQEAPATAEGPRAGRKGDAPVTSGAFEAADAFESDPARAERERKE